MPWVAWIGELGAFIKLVIWFDDEAESMDDDEAESMDDDDDDEDDDTVCPFTLFAYPPVLGSGKGCTPNHEEPEKRMSIAVCLGATSLAIPLPLFFVTFE
jgi:hypothetical protein